MDVLSLWRSGRYNDPGSGLSHWASRTTTRPRPGGFAVTSSNPAFSQDMFAGYEQVYGRERTRSTVTTVQGTVGKTFLMLAILSFTALWSWNALGTPQFPQV